MLYMFRTVLLHLQEQLYKLLCGYSHTTARRIDIHQMRGTAYKVAPEDGVIQSETCTA